MVRPSSPPAPGLVTALAAIHAYYGMGVTGPQLAPLARNSAGRLWQVEVWGKAPHADRTDPGVYYGSTLGEAVMAAFGSVPAAGDGA